MSKAKVWTCVAGCGACCRLAPNEREEAIKHLNSEEKEIYDSMVDADGWCIHYDKSNRLCTIYEKRPSFCNVKNICKIFSIPDEEKNSFSITCCKQQIRDIYGGRSKEMKKFLRAISLLVKH